MFLAIQLFDQQHCHVMQALMKDPIIAADGQNYERGVMQEWLAGHDTPPITRHTLAHSMLIPNLVLRSIMHLYMTPIM